MADIQWIDAAEGIAADTEETAPRFGAASMQAMLAVDEEDRIQWFLDMFNSEVIHEVTAEDIWAGTATGYISPAVQAESLVPQEAVPVSGDLEIDGEAGINFFVELTAATDLDAVVNLLPGVVYTLRVEQGGSGGYAFTASGADHVIGALDAYATTTGAVFFVLLTNRGTTETPVIELVAGAGDAA